MPLSNHRMNVGICMWKNSFVKSSNCIRMWNSWVEINESKQTLQTAVESYSNWLRCGAIKLLLFLQIHCWIQWHLRIHPFRLFRLECSDYVKYYACHTNCSSWVFIGIYFQISLHRHCNNFFLLFWKSGVAGHANDNGHCLDFMWICWNVLELCVHLFLLWIRRNGDQSVLRIWWPAIPVRLVPTFNGA